MSLQFVCSIKKSTITCQVLLTNPMQMCVCVIDLTSSVPKEIVSIPIHTKPPQALEKYTHTETNVCLFVKALLSHHATPSTHCNLQQNREERSREDQVEPGRGGAPYVCSQSNVLLTTDTHNKERYTQRRSFLMGLTDTESSLLHNTLWICPLYQKNTKITTT